MREAGVAWPLVSEIPCQQHWMRPFCTCTRQLLDGAQWSICPGSWAWDRLAETIIPRRQHFAKLSVPDGSVPDELS